MELAKLWELMSEAALLDKAAARAVIDGDMRGAEQLLEQRLYLKEDGFIQDLLAFLRTS
jgi:hypothetical protein